MGLFLAMSAVVSADVRSVERASTAMAGDHDGTFEPTATPTSHDSATVLAAYPAGVTVVYPDGFVEWDDASRALSVALRTSVFSLHVHDGDPWLLFTRGEQVAQFNRVRDYWGEGVNPAAWLPDPSVVAAAAVPGTGPEHLAPYLKPWDDKDVAGMANARPGDEFAHGQDWQAVDFMRALGFGYPDRNDGGTNRFALTLQ